MYIWMKASRWRNVFFGGRVGGGSLNTDLVSIRSQSALATQPTALFEHRRHIETMPQPDQGVTKSRYTVIPRTAIFLRRGESYLLLKGAPTKCLWANKYNGLGGHVERGEDVLSSAKRELLEETSLTADLWLCGTLMVDAGETGIALYIFSGECEEGEPKPSDEGLAEWIRYDTIGKLPVVEDLPVLLKKIHSMKRGDKPFSARSLYDEDGRLVVVFS
jgi:8-oxo-dGTP diphosphatase